MYCNHQKLQRQKSGGLETRGIITGPPKYQWIAEPEGKTHFSANGSLPKATCMDCCLKFKKHDTKGSSAAQKKYLERDRKTILCFRVHLSTSPLLPTATQPQSLNSLGVKRHNWPTSFDENLSLSIWFFLLDENLTMFYPTESRQR